MAVAINLTLRRVSRAGWVRRQTSRLCTSAASMKLAKQRMRFEGAGFQFRVELDADEPGVIGELDDFGQEAVRREAGEEHAFPLEILAIGGD